MFELDEDISPIKVKSIKKSHSQKQSEKKKSFSISASQLSPSDDTGPDSKKKDERNKKSSLMEGENEKSSSASASQSSSSDDTGPETKKKDYRHKKISLKEGLNKKSHPHTPKTFVTRSDCSTSDEDEAGTADSKIRRRSRSKEQRSFKKSRRTSPSPSDSRKESSLSKSQKVPKNTSKSIRSLLEDVPRASGEEVESRTPSLDAGRRMDETSISTSPRISKPLSSLPQDGKVETLGTDIHTYIFPFST